VISLALSLVLTQTLPADNNPHWAIASVDRASLIAIDTNTIKLGISGAQSAMLTIVADPQPGQPTLFMMRYEFDCFADKVSINGGMTESPHAAPQVHNEASEWEKPVAGSMTEAALKHACHGAAIPEDWAPVPQLSSDLLVDFYYEKILGRPNPFASK
jgi:hypothetical protein